MSVRLVLLAVLALAALAGCSPKNVVGTNAPPETYLFISAPVDSIAPSNHRIELHWYGTDPDGDVVGYDFRMIAGGGPADPPWTRLAVTTTDSMFTVFTGDSAQVTPTFEFRAVDDGGEVDPSPARQTFRLNNLAPVATFTTPLFATDTTYASATVSWQVDDPDGGGPGLRFRLWLDGNQANMDSTEAFTFTVPSHRFLQGGQFLAGPRTLFLQAVDDGGRQGPITSCTWHVRAPAVMQRAGRGRVLVIDDVPSGGSNNATFDAFYAGGLAGVSGRLLADSGSVLRVQTNPNMFRSSQDFAQMLRQFETVVWYRGLETSVSTLMRTHQDSLLEWVASGGGRLYLDGPYLVAGRRTPGAIREDFVTTHLASDALRLAFNSALQDSTAGWTNRSTSRLRSSRYGGQMTTAVVVPGAPGESPGLRVFLVRDTADVALWALPDQLTPANSGFEAAVGVRRDFPGDGRLILLSLPLRAGAAAQTTPLYLAMTRDLLRP